VLVFSKVHLPLLWLSVPLVFCFLLLIGSLVVINVTGASSARVNAQVGLLMVTNCLLLLLAFAFFSAFDSLLHDSLYAATATAFACATAFGVMKVRRPAEAVIDWSVGRLLLKLRLWTFAEIFALFAIYAVSLLPIRR
jgi:hypothetical protein